MAAADLAWSFNSEHYDNLEGGRLESPVYKWSEIPETPPAPGVYAWYYTPDISDFDTNKTIETLESLKRNGETKEAKKLLTDFFDKFLFRYFTEDPYEVSLKGPLKPKYKGALSHVPSLSETLLDRIVEDPDRLNAIQSTLKLSVPDFASPIYIGMSSNLQKRLTKHKALIEKYYSNSTKEVSINSADRDQCFAWQIYSRKINPPSLFVIAKEVLGGSKNYVDIENILNRIHFPVFGRN
ncbi:hypothetical protein [Marinobacter sp.]|uniref:hypothetical protein n=1 Tax=Marinobacter sp. TaxID=50741 RepID=UPI00356AAC5C